MELFKILGTIAINSKDANKSLDEVSDKGENAHSKLSGAFSKIGSAALAVGKTVAVGMGAAATAVAGLVTKSVQSYAEYEQLVGGIETLFGQTTQTYEEFSESMRKKGVTDLLEINNAYLKTFDDAVTVIRNADEAYKTAGMSANEYMSTVTSFSASLIASLDGDTAKAAEYANRAIIDMSDNANKMGTDISMIQNAYQGFAKQNYTMLDNLKLGYGGTKEEMARLISEASKMKDVQKELGIVVKDGDMSFANIANAISVVQKKMGITGTTAREASETISGSLGMAKAAWENMITAMADTEADFDGTIQAFIESVKTVADNIIPVAMTALEGVSQLVTELGQMLVAELPPMLESLLPSLIEGATGLINSVVELLPSLIDLLVNTALPQFLTAIGSIAETLMSALPGIMEQLGSALVTALPTLMTAVGNMLVGLADFIQTNLPVFTEKAKDMVGGLGQKIQENLPTIISKGLDILLGLSESILTNIPMLVETGMDLILSLVKGIVAALPELIAKAPQIVTNLANTISNSMATIFAKGLEIIWELIKGIIAAIPDLVRNIPKIIEAIIAVWNAVNWLNLGKNLITGISKGIKNMGGSLKNTASNLFNKLKDSTVNIFKSIGNGIMHPINTAKSLFSGAVTGIKNLAVNGFTALKNSAKSIFNGVKDAITHPIKTAKDLIKSMVDTIKGFFTKLDIKFPPIKLPHFKLVGEFSLENMTVPHLSIEWYKKAMNAPMLLNEPTIFGYNPATGQVRGAGEAGEEVVAGASMLMRMIKGAVNSELDSVAYYLQQLISMLADYFPELIAASGHDIVTDDGTIIGHYTPMIDKRLGELQKLKERGR